MTDRYLMTAALVHDVFGSAIRLDPEAAVREVARLLRERHPELCEPPWTPVAEGLPAERGRYEVTEKLYGATRTGCSNFRDGEWDSPYDVLAWRPAPPPWDGSALVQCEGCGFGFSSLEDGRCGTCLQFGNGNGPDDELNGGTP